MKKISIIFLLSLVLGMVGCSSYDMDSDIVINRVKVGDVVPEFTVKQADGASDAPFLKADFEGRRSVIVFFQTTCADCRRELPKIHEAWQLFSKYRAFPDVQFILISRGENAATVAEYWTSVAESKPSFDPMPYYLDPERETFNKFANTYVPRLYLVGTDGRVKFMATEEFDFDGAELIDLIDALQ